MSSPIVYDREGNAVGGGANQLTTSLFCSTCNTYWKSTTSELADAQGLPRNWEITK